MQTVDVRLLINSGGAPLGPKHLGMLLRNMIDTQPHVLGAVELVGDGFGHLVPDDEVMTARALSWDGDRIDDDNHAGVTDNRMPR